MLRYFTVNLVILVEKPAQRVARTFSLRIMRVCHVQGVPQIVPRVLLLMERAQNVLLVIIQNQMELVLSAQLKKM